jgi:hypothetical protein
MEDVSRHKEGGIARSTDNMRETRLRQMGRAGLRHPRHCAMK